MLPTAGLSAFMNNTPLVAMLIPAVNEWAKKHQIPVSKLMLPLSCASILGGVCTLIGTSTNLVVNGMLIRAHDAQRAAEGAAAIPRGLAMFDIAWVGVPCAIGGIAFIMLTSRFLLPNRRPSIASVADPREYTIEMEVEPGSPLVDKSIEQAGLRHLPGLFLAEISREGVTLPAVGPEEKLRGNDHLVFVGIVDSVVDLQKIRGLKPATNQVFKLDAPRSQRCLIEAVASASCPVVGKTIRDGRFRSLYNAVVIAVARHGERVRGKIGDIVLRAGDTLLLEAHPSFVKENRNNRHFYLVSQVENSRPPRYDKARMALGIVLGMVLLVTISESLGALKITLGTATLDLGQITMLKGAMIAAALMIMTRCVQIDEARRTIDWDVLVAIACSLGIGVALDRSGAADMVTEAVFGGVGNHPWIALALIYAVTLVATEILTNNAAAALMFPFAMSTAAHLGADVRPFVVCVMIAASCGFATPIGYQTNLMVYGPGGYRFSDYVRLGVPLDLLVGAIAVAVTPLAWPFYP